MKDVALLPLVVGLVLPAVLVAQTPKVRVAITSFENNSTWSYWGGQLGEAAADELATQLVKSGKFTVIERRQLQDIMTEQNLGASGAVNAATAAQLGQLLGAQVVIIGSVTKFSIDRKSGGIGPLAASYSEAESMLDVRLVNTTTGEILSVAEGGGKKRFGGAGYKDVRFEQSYDAGIAQEALRPAVEDAVKEIVARAGELASLKPVAGAASVVGVRGGDIYLDKGENFGVTVGQKFDVYRVVDEIKDAHGNVLDRITEKVGQVEVMRVLSQSSVARLVSGDAKEGDTAQAAGQ
jgi:curli biogenesis system outer membrane secretion channel CsgG